VDDIKSWGLELGFQRVAITVSVHIISAAIQLARRTPPATRHIERNLDLR
jgi:hypothetical protein